MTKTSTPPNCKGYGEMNQPICHRGKSNLLLSAWTIFFLIAFFFPILPLPGQEISERTPVKETRESRLKKQTASPVQDQEIQDSSKKIPWNSLSSQAKIKVRQVVSERSLFRRLPQQKIHADPEMFQFLLEHPDLVVGFWEKLGVTQLSLQELNQDQFLMKETTGTTAIAEVVYRTKDLCIVYARGLYKGPFLVKSYDGEAVLVLHIRSLRDADNEPVIICDLDVFVRIDHLGVDFLAKLFATTLGKIADSNFEQTVAFVGYVSESAGINAESVKRTGYQIKSVREAVRDDFSDVVDRVAMRIAHRNSRNLSLHSVSEAETYPIPINTPFAQKQIDRTKPKENAMILAVGSEKIKQEFDQTFRSDPFFTVYHISEESEEKVNEKIQAISSGLEERGELSAPIPIGLSTLDNSAFDHEKTKQDDNTVLKNRAVFTTPKIAR
ncbi:MAG: hypothetical protein LBQ50_09355 [Planctomycetaceae bacterium]|jgi:hypothetical protein|nr:hypothetical protein [Planctomycetaceae bacterium]